MTAILSEVCSPMIVDSINLNEPASGNQLVEEVSMQSVASRPPPGRQSDRGGFQAAGDNAPRPGRLSFGNDACPMLGEREGDLWDE